VFKAYMLKESLESLWNYRYEAAMVKYLRRWMDQLRWQRLPSFQKLSLMLAKHIDRILNYCRTKVRFGVVEAVNGNIRMLLNRGRGYTNMGSERESDKEAISCGFRYGLKSHEFDVRHGDPFGL
jgi:transposase